MTKEEILTTLPAVCKIETLLASGLVDMHPIVLRRWCQSGKYPYGTRQGKCWYLEPRQFMAWFEGKDINATKGKRSAAKR